MSVLNRFPTGGAPTDELTATPAEVMSGYKFLGAGSDDEQVGTLALTGNAVVNHVLQGETFYNTNPKQKLTGTMTVNSILSFNVAAYSGRRVLAKWGNPKAAAGRPYSGVYIRYSTGGYPGKTGGTQVYKGAGSNTASGGQSQVYLDMPALNTTYYMSCIPYVTTNMGELLGEPLNTTVRTSAEQVVTITGTQNYTIPVGFSLIDIFCVGAGGAGGAGTKGGSDRYAYAGNGGGGGYTSTVKNIAISTGQVLNCIIGAGGIGANQNPGTAGGFTTVIRNGTTLCSAAGGREGGRGGSSGGGPGGSGGGTGGYNDYSNYRYDGGAGGSNGGDGSRNGGTYAAGTGQHSTTTPFGEGGTQYGPGGGGGGTIGCLGGTGGVNGGGHGGQPGMAAQAGAANSGGGGGGGWSDTNDTAQGANGGSGIILMRLH